MKRREAPEAGGLPGGVEEAGFNRRKTNDAGRVKDRERTQLRGKRDQRTVKPLLGREPGEPGQPGPARPGAARRGPARPGAAQPRSPAW